MLSKLGLRQGFLSLAKEAVMRIASELPGIQHKRVHVSKPGRKTKKLDVPCDSLLGHWRLRFCRWHEWLRQGGRAIMLKGNACIFGLVIIGC